MRSFSLYILFVCLSFSSCTKVMNPYDEEFGCLGGDYGTCDDVTSAYEKSFKENDESFSPMVKVKINEDDEFSENHSTPGAGEGDEIGDSTDGKNGAFKRGEIYDHQKALLTELQGIIGDEKTPMLLPAKQMRLLVLGYEDNHMTYYGHRYVYFITEPQRWVLPTNRIGIPLRGPETLFRQ